MTAEPKTHRDTAKIRSEIKAAAAEASGIWDEHCRVEDLHRKAQYRTLQGPEEARVDRELQGQYPGLTHPNAGLYQNAMRVAGSLERAAEAKERTAASLRAELHQTESGLDTEKITQRSHLSKKRDRVEAEYDRLSSVQRDLIRRIYLEGATGLSQDLATVKTSIDSVEAELENLYIADQIVTEGK